MTDNQTLKSPPDSGHRETTHGDKNLSEALFLLVACRQIFVAIRNGRAISVETAERYIRTIDDFRAKVKA